MFRQQHWGHWSTMHWCWSHVTHVTYNTRIKLWVLCNVCHNACIDWVLMECIDNNIGDIGAQSIGDGLKSLKSLTTLYLRSEWWVTLLCDCVCVEYIHVYFCLCLYPRAHRLDKIILDLARRSHINRTLRVRLLNSMLDNFHLTIREVIHFKL